MNEPTIITTPSGDRLAVLPLADYERLVAAAEEAADVRAYDAAKQRLASGEDEFIPAEFAARILAGESPIRVYREFRGINSRDLAAAAEISADYLSQFEKGDRDGTFDTMRKIARALNVSLDDLG